MKEVVMTTDNKILTFGYEREVRDVSTVQG